MTAAVDEPSPQDETADAPPVTPGSALVAVTSHRASITEKIAYAKHLAESGLLPKAYQKNPANVLYACEYGEMLGLPPMAAINGIHIIEGKPTASAALMSALIRRAGHRLRVVGNDQKATVQIVRADDPDFTFESVWTMDRAKLAGLAGKSVWKNYPAAMLKARALTECARDACQEALSGVMYTPEELGAEVNEDGEPIKAVAERVNVSPITSMDWPAEVQVAEQRRDRAKLGELWKLAKVVEPLNESLHGEIAAAGKRVAAVLDLPQSATEPVTDAAPDRDRDPDGAVDAELVEDEPITVARRAADLFDQLMVCESAAQVDELFRAEIVANPVAQVDVSGLLTQDAREALDIRPGTYSLGALAHILRTYTEKHGSAVGAAAD